MKKLFIVAILFLVTVAALGYSSTEAAINKNNGAKSKNTVSETKNTKTKVTQANSAFQSNLVGVDQNSGKNKTNSNTDGNVTNTSGTIEVAVEVANQASVNDASLANCGCEQSGTAKNVGNGAKSTNKATSTIQNTTQVTQTNNSVQTNTVLVSQNSGKNQANDNTGGEVEVGSGNTSAEIKIENTANSNTLVVQ